MKIRIIAGPEWIRYTSPEAELFRIFYDQPEKDLVETLTYADISANLTVEDIRAAANFGMTRDLADLPEDWISPHVIANRIYSHLDPKNTVK